MRAQILRVSLAVLENLLEDGEHHFATEGLPAGTRILSAHVEPERHAIALVCEHESFPDIRNLDEFPDLVVSITTIESTVDKVKGAAKK